MLGRRLLLVESIDITSNGLGTLGSGATGMCDADATACGNDVYQVSQLLGTLQSNGFDDVANNISSLPPGMTSGAATAIVSRSNLKTTTQQ